MTPVSTWTEAALVNFIKTGAEESVHLDYKDSRSLQLSDRCKKDLSKDVSAFANSDGGTIVYGIREENHLPIEIDEGSDPAVITKEWLENILLSTIQRRIDGLEIHPVSLTNQPGRVAYVIVVPASQRAPHMAYDKRFYKRHNFQSVPMEEYEVRDVANRLNGPDLHVRMFLSDVELRPAAQVPLVFPSSNPNVSAPIKFRMAATNRSPAPAEYALYQVALDQRWVIQSTPAQLSRTTCILTVNQQINPAQCLVKKQAIPGDFPLWQDIELEIIGAVQLSIPCQDQQPYILSIRVDSPRMTTRTQTVQLWKAQDSLIVLTAN